MAAPENMRAKRCSDLFARANIAANHIAITGKAHAFFGDGTLSSLALRGPLAPLPAQLSEAAVDALILVLTQTCEETNV